MNMGMLIAAAALLYFYFSSQTPTASTSTSTTGSGTTGTGTTTTTGILPGTLAKLNAALASDIAAHDPNIAASGIPTPYQWNYLLQHVAVPSLASATLPLETIFPGVDLTQPMTPQVYWAGMGPYLQANLPTGLTGLREAYVRKGNGWAV